MKRDMKPIVNVLDKAIADLEQLRLKSQLSLDDYVEAMQVGNGKSLGSELYSKLFPLYADQMPYGTVTAKNGDPFIWIESKLREIF